MLELLHWLCFGCLLHSVLALQFNAAHCSSSSVRTFSKTCTLRMTADSEDAPTTKPRTQQEIRREVQAAIAEANYQVAGKMMSYQDITMDALRSQRGRKAPTARLPVKPRSKPVDLAQLKVEEEAKYQRTKYRLVLDNAFVTALCGSGVWGLASYKSAMSYGLGGLLGTLYLVLLGRFVETLGSSGGGRAAGGGGPARLALVVVLVLVCGKNKDTLEVVPAVAGFLTYQLTTLLQAFYDDESDDSSSSGNDSDSSSGNSGGSTINNS